MDITRNGNMDLIKVVTHFRHKLPIIQATGSIAASDITSDKLIPLANGKGVCDNLVATIQTRYKKWIELVDKVYNGAATYQNVVDYYSNPNNQPHKEESVDSDGNAIVTKKSSNVKAYNAESVGVWIQTMAIALQRDCDYMKKDIAKLESDYKVWTSDKIAREAEEKRLQQEKSVISTFTNSDNKWDIMLKQLLSSNVPENVAKTIVESAKQAAIQQPEIAPVLEQPPVVEVTPEPCDVAQVVTKEELQAIFDNKVRRNASNNPKKK